MTEVKSIKDMVADHREKFNRIQEIEIDNLRKIKLEGLVTELEATYEIPKAGQLKLQAYRYSFPAVMVLLDEVKRARWS